MTCPKCNHEVHEDSQGVIACLSCGYHEPINQVRDTAIYSNRDLMKRESTNDAGEKLQSTEETLKERGNRYGEFANHAALSQEFKRLFRTNVENHGRPENFEPFILEAIDMIFHKLARIANGDPTYDDNYRDIAGFAELVVKELNRESRTS